MMGFSRKKNLLMISIENSRGGELKSLEFQGIYQKLRKKPGFPGGQCKEMENSRRDTVNLTGSPGGSTSKKSISSIGALQFFSGKVQ